MEKQNLSRGLLELNPRGSDAKVGVFPVGKLDILVVEEGLGGSSALMWCQI